MDRMPITRVNPQVNIGTGTMRNRQKFAGVIDRFINDLASFDFPGGKTGRA